MAARERPPPARMAGSGSVDELDALKKAAAVVLAMDVTSVADALDKGKWIEVKCDGEEVQE